MCIRRALGLKLRRSARITVRVNTTTGIIPGPNGPEPTLVAELGSTRPHISLYTFAFSNGEANSRFLSIVFTSLDQSGRHPTPFLFARRVCLQCRTVHLTSAGLLLLSPVCCTTKERLTSRPSKDRTSIMATQVRSTSGNFALSYGYEARRRSTTRKQSAKW